MNNTVPSAFLSQVLYCLILYGFPLNCRWILCKINLEKSIMGEKWQVRGWILLHDYTIKNVTVWFDFSVKLSIYSVYVTFKYMKPRTLCFSSQRATTWALWELIDWTTEKVTL